MDAYNTGRKGAWLTVGMGLGAAFLLCASLVLWLLPQTGGGRAQAAPRGGMLAAPLSEQPYISVRGMGIVTARPDLLNIQVGVVIQHAKLADAQWLAASKIEDAMRILKEAGIPDKDIATARFSVEAVMEYPQNQAPRQVGYRVTHILNLKVREIGGAGKLLDQLTAAGIDRVQSLQFGFTDPSALLKQAREQAMSDAKAKAQQIASLGGVGLGTPIAVQDGGSNTAVNTRSGVFFDSGPTNSGAGPTTGINPGEQEVRVEVNVVYAIK